VEFQILTCIIVDIVYTYNSTLNYVDIGKASKLPISCFTLWSVKFAVFAVFPHYNFIAKSYPMLDILLMNDQILTKQKFGRIPK